MHVCAENLQAEEVCSGFGGGGIGVVVVALVRVVVGLMKTTHTHTSKHQDTAIRQ